MLVLRREDGDWTNVAHVASGDPLRIAVRRFRLAGGVRMQGEVEIEDPERHYSFRGSGIASRVATFRVPGDPRLLCRRVAAATCGAGDRIRIVHRDGDSLGLVVMSVDVLNAQLGFEDDDRHFLIERPECRKRPGRDRESRPARPDPSPPG